MGLRTPLYDRHVAAGARMVDFGGWDMPVNYGSQIDEHHKVRRDAGFFDVSHMTVLDLTGARTREFLRWLLANDVAKLKKPGKALYSCMLDEQGGVVDDLIVYFMREDFFRVVVNAGTRAKDLAWIEPRAAKFGVRMVHRGDLAMVAVQGPNARARFATLLAPADRERALALGAFQSTEAKDAQGAPWFVATTGYTGEDGFEFMFPAADAPQVFDRLVAAGIPPAGLGARDTLRLEAAMNLYGQDMDEKVTPLESGLAWTVAFEPADRDFIGRKALEAQRAKGDHRRFVGLILEDKGVLRGHMRVVTPAGDGEITSGSFSPTLEKSIALARVPAGDFDRVQVDIRGKLCAARVVKPPFARHGKALVS
jgi:aminomethyltransferase